MIEHRIISAATHDIVVAPPKNPYSSDLPPDLYTDPSWEIIAFVPEVHSVSPLSDPRRKPTTGAINSSVLAVFARPKERPRALEDEVPGERDELREQLAQVTPLVEIACAWSRAESDERARLLIDLANAADGLVALRSALVIAERAASA